MLVELVAWAGIQADPAARRLGYAKAAVSLWSRRRRCHRAWAGHEQQTREFALSIAQACRHRDTAWLLGGGTLADLPLAELSALFKRVVIFDIVWLASARRRAKQFPNVELRQADVTGMVAPLAEWRAGLPLPIPSMRALAELDSVPPDCVLSLNLLSQLPLLPMEYVQKHGVSRVGAESFGRAILQMHLDALQGMSCPVGLVADARRIWRSRAGETVMSENALLGLSLPTPQREWRWPVAPRGEIDNETSLDITVQASRWDGAGSGR
ncbi:hypothetical protein [Ferrovibrio sp.]|uniref:hypothetical protein n=1 Tax=Ferrovibrio sp. TaxID=1917215 RepID=UPI0026136301|nr:hypothetical protein [Ferrovibrio sp.]